jgi:hypothetical protein
MVDRSPTANQKWVPKARLFVAYSQIDREQASHWGSVALLALQSHPKQLAAARSLLGKLGLGLSPFAGDGDPSQA